MSESIEKMQEDLEKYLAHLNHERPHQGRNMKGRRPYAAFVDGLPKKQTPEASAKAGKEAQKKAA